MADLIQSRPYQPDPAHCCERCVFGTGEHAGWCEFGRPYPNLSRLDDIVWILALAGCGLGPITKRGER